MARLVVHEIEGWEGTVEYELKFWASAAGRIDILLKACNDGDPRTSFSAEAQNVSVMGDVEKIVLLLAKRISIQLKIPQPYRCRVDLIADEDDELEDLYNL